MIGSTPNPIPFSGGAPWTGWGTTSTTAARTSTKGPRGWLHFEFHAIAGPNYCPDPLGARPTPGLWPPGKLLEVGGAVDRELAREG
jgi:hypothetical protein